jgi:hypothetical protein
MAELIQRVSNSLNASLASLASNQALLETCAPEVFLLIRTTPPADINLLAVLESSLNDLITSFAGSHRKEAMRAARVSRALDALKLALIGRSECACVSRPAVEAQDRVATEEAVSGVEARSVGRCVVVSPFSITYRPIEGACFCGPVSGAYRGSVRTGRWGRSATGARGVSDHASETGRGSGRRSQRSGSTGPW